jgi:hypothetical protein
MQLTPRCLASQLWGKLDYGDAGRLELVKLNRNLQSKKKTSVGLGNGSSLSAGVGKLANGSLAKGGGLGAMFGKH